MTRKYLLVLLITASFFSISRSAMAFVIGVYGEGGYGSFTAHYRTLSITEKLGKSKNVFYGGGLLVDTNCAKDKLINLRFKFGGESFNSQWSANTSGFRVGLSTILGFGVVRTQLIRFWLGPQFGIKVVSGKFDRNYWGIEKSDPEAFLLSGGLIFLGQFYNENVKYTMFGVDVGVSTGINFNIGSLFTFAIEGGAKYAFHDGDIDRKAQGIGASLPMNDTKKRSTLSGFEGYGSVAFIFRVRDNY